jgi:ABC-type bacteriocin/lantibiotic exporter with double-glycine peptidase domain
VLVFRLVTVALVESVPTALRTYVFFGHTTNRVDLELWARRFWHLVAPAIA